MQALFQIGQFFISTFALTLLTPFFWLVVFLIYLQYRRLAGMEQRLFGRALNPVGTQVLASLGLGFLGGFTASVLLVVLGLSLEQIGLYFIWAVAILLLLVHPRYLCFAYAGGVVALAVIMMRAVVNFVPELAGYTIVESLLKVHLPAMLVLIALLHLVEALLIYIGGHRGCSPLYLKHPGSGEVVGGFSLQRFWPLPLVAMLVMVVLQAESAGVSMPGWWPVIKSMVQPGPGETLQYILIPVAAGVGYADLALTSTPREKSRISARNLAVYSLVLLSLAVAAEYYPLFTLTAVLFAPLGHELLIIYGNRRELSRRPRYCTPSRGVRVMMVLSDSAAAQAGLREEDIILKVNGRYVQDPRELFEQIEESYFMVLLEGTRGGEQFSTVLKKRRHPEHGNVSSGTAASHAIPAAYLPLHRGASLGLIPVPSPRSPVYVETGRAAPLSRLGRFLKGKFSRFV